MDNNIAENAVDPVDTLALPPGGRRLLEHRGAKRKRAKESFVWDMTVTFRDETRCIICSKVIKSASASNVQQHLSRRHPDIYEEAKKADELKKSAMSNAPVVMNFLNSLSTPASNSTSDSAFSSLDRLFTMAVGTSSVPLDFVENEYFKAFAESIPSFKSPCQRRLRADVIEECSVIEETIKENLARCHRIAAEVNITKFKGFSRPYLSLIAHYIDINKTQLQHNLLDLVEIKHLNGNYIKEWITNTLNVYEVPIEKVVRFVGHNGSNFMSTFEENFSFELSNDENTALDSDSLTSLSRMELENLIVRKNEPSGCENDGEELSEGTLSDELAETFGSYLKCTVHSIVLFLKSVLDFDSYAKTVKDSFLRIAKQFSQSHLLTKQLILETRGRNLLVPVNDSWLSFFAAYSRALEVNREVNIVCARSGVLVFSKDLIKDVEDMVNLLAPFNDVVQKMQNLAEPTISHVYPCFRLFDHHLKKYVNGTTENVNLIILARKLRSALHCRFPHILHSGEEQHDPLFILTTCLDRNTAAVIPVDRRHAVISLIKRIAANPNQDITMPQIQPAHFESISNMDTMYAELLANDIAQSSVQLDLSIANEIDMYGGDGAWSVPKTPITVIPFWTACQKVYPTLSAMALDILCVPASLTDIEKTFSNLTMGSSSHNSRVLPALLRERMMLTFNKNLVV